MTVKLPKCAPDVDPFYTYPVAIRCDCDICSTATTECETAWALSGQERRGQILPWLHIPGTSSITEGVSQSRIWSHPVMFLIIEFSGQMRLNALSSYCSKHYCCRNVVRSLTMANPVFKKIDAVSFPYRLFTLCDLPLCRKCTWTKQSLGGGNRPQRHDLLWNSIFIRVLASSQ